MSAVNIVASFLSPEYPAMYLVRTPDMDRAEESGGKFDGVLAELVVPDSSNGQDKLSTDLYDGYKWATILLWFSLAVSPLIIVGALSEFHPGESSTAAQRGWILSWLVVGSISSGWAAWCRLVVRMNGDSSSNIYLLICLIPLLPFWVPTIGGMVTVGQELREYGVCVRYDSE